MNDPYKVLGVSPTASDDEIKKAYRALARKYHPDNYVGNPLADLVQEKMKEINEAYDTIQKERAKGGGHTASAGYGSATGERAETYNRVRQMINAGSYVEADALLSAIPQSERNAEWNFLKGCILTRRGWYYDAQKYYETACYMDPENYEYKSALDAIRSARSGRTYKTDTTRAGSSDVCDICSAMICADCCCECMGGDLIRCC